MKFSFGFSFFMKIYAFMFFLFIVTPLLVISVLAFNNADYIGFPFKGFTLDWFFCSTHRKGVFCDSELLNSIFISLKVAFVVSLVSVIIGLFSALYFEKKKSKLKDFFYYISISPLIIPGVILGIAILSYSSMIMMWLDDNNIFIFDDYLSPGIFLVILGQVSFISSYTMLIIQSRLKKFDYTLIEAASSLKATNFNILRHIMIPFLKPALIKSFLAGFVLSFSNFNTTVFLSGGDPTLPIYLFSQVKYSLTPVVNAVSFLIILSMTVFAFINFVIERKKL